MHQDRKFDIGGSNSNCNCSSQYFHGFLSPSFYVGHILSVERIAVRKDTKGKGLRSSSRVFPNKKSHGGTNRQKLHERGEFRKIATNWGVGGFCFPWGDFGFSEIIGGILCHLPVSPQNILFCLNH